MKIKDMVVTAIRNIKSASRMAGKMIFGMTFVVMVIICFLVILVSYNSYIDDFDEKHMTDCFCYNIYDNSSIDSEYINELIKRGEEKKKEYNATEYSIVSVIKEENADSEFVVGNTTINVDGKSYTPHCSPVFESKLYTNMQFEEASVGISLYQNRMNIFPKSTLNRYDGEPLIGAYPENEGEIMLDTYILNLYGVEEPYDKLLGKNVELLLNDENGQGIVLEKYVLTGIFDAELYELRESYRDYNTRAEHIYINPKSEDITKFGYIEGCIRYYYEEYSSLTENYKYMTSLVAMDMSELYDAEHIEQKITPDAMEYALLYWVMNSIGKLLLVIAGVICLIVIFSVAYIMGFYRARTKHYRTMQGYIGMQKKDITIIYGMELLIMLTASVVAGICVSYAFVVMFDSVMKVMLNFSIL